MHFELLHTSAMHPRLKFLHNDVDIDGGGIDDVVNSFKAALQSSCQDLASEALGNIGDSFLVNAASGGVLWSVGTKFVLEHVHCSTTGLFLLY